MLEDNDFKDLFSNFEVKDILIGSQTVEQQTAILREFYNYVDPIEIPFDYREDHILDRESKTYVPTLIQETFQYVPIIDVLTLIMQNNEVKNAIEFEKGSETGALASFIDIFFTFHGIKFSIQCTIFLPASSP